MAQQGYQSDAQGASATTNTMEDLSITPEQFNPIAVQMISNTYTSINGNLILNKNVQFLSNNVQSIRGHIFNLPAPLITNEGRLSLLTGTIHSSDGDVLNYTIQNDGRVFIEGEFANESPGVITLQMNPYLAALPLSYAPNIAIL